jgi:hypothetical protein
MESRAKNIAEQSAHLLVKTLVTVGAMDGYLVVAGAFSFVVIGPRGAIHSHGAHTHEGF